MYIFGKVRKTGHLDLLILSMGTQYFVVYGFNSLSFLQSKGFHRSGGDEIWSFIMGPHLNL
jgi:hypothetical protein